MNSRKKLMWLVFAGMMVPPMAWIFFLLYTSLFTFDEILSVLFSPQMLIYMGIATAIILYSFNAFLKKNR